MIFGEGVKQLANLLLVTVIEMARGAKDLDCVDFRVPNFRQQPRRQRLVDVAVCGENAAHYGLVMDGLQICA